MRLTLRQKPKWLHGRRCWVKCRRSGLAAPVLRSEGSAVHPLVGLVCFWDRDAAALKRAFCSTAAGRLRRGAHACSRQPPTGSHEQKDSLPSLPGSEQGGMCTGTGRDNTNRKRLVEDYVIQIKFSVTFTHPALNSWWSTQFTVEQGSRSNSDSININYSFSQLQCRPLTYLRISTSYQVHTSVNGVWVNVGRRAWWRKCVQPHLHLTSSLHYVV